MPHDRNYMAVVTMAEQLQQEVVRLRRAAAKSADPTADVAALVLRCEELERQRNEARSVARERDRRVQTLETRLKAAQQIIATLTQERDHWKKEARREHQIVENADAACATLRADVARLTAENERLTAMLCELRDQLKGAVVVGDDEAREA